MHPSNDRAASLLRTVGTPVVCAEEAEMKPLISLTGEWGNGDKGMVRALGCGCEVRRGDLERSRWRGKTEKGVPNINLFPTISIRNLLAISAN